MNSIVVHVNSWALRLRGHPGPLRVVCPQVSIEEEHYEPQTD